MHVVVVGAGYVGLVAAACLARAGRMVTLVERDPARVADLRRGALSRAEVGLAERLAEGLASGALSIVDRPDSVGSAAFVILAVGTPNGPTGAPDLAALWDAVDTLRPSLASGCVVVLKSTVPPGTTARVQARLGDHVEVVANPEFLRQGRAVEDFERPSRTVLGARTFAAADLVRALYAPLHGGDAPVFVTDPRTAELAKYAANALLAVRVAWINEIAAVADRVGGDVRAVAAIVGADPRLGPSHLAPGPGFGGSCLPKDLAALVALADGEGVEVPVLDAAARSNARARASSLDRARDLVGTLRDRDIAVLGLSFKAGTDDTRDSPAVDLVRDLLREGARVSVHDPMARDAPWGATRASDAYEAARGADLVVIATEWPEYARLDPLHLAAIVRQRVVLDLRLLLDPHPFAQAGFVVRQVGRPSSTPSSGSVAMGETSRSEMEPPR